MKKQIIPLLFGTVITTILLPWFATAFVSGCAEMPFCIILLFAINPLFSVSSGVLAGRSIKKLWYLPPAYSVLFLAGAWLFFDMGDMAFVMYAAVYFALGLLAMLLSSLVMKKKTA